MNPLLLLALLAAAPPDADAQAAAKRATVPAGMIVSLWAAEPLLANPVAFCFDEQGRAYVAETTRFNKGVPDTRHFMRWLDDDLACRSVDDRLKMYLKHNYGDFTKYDDQIRRVWDEKGAGIADKSSIFAEGFNQPADGLIAGVLARKGDLFVANIPSLYRFKDIAGAGEKKEILSTGYGVHVQFVGHDLHGLRMGPDGRLYFTIGDRGLNVINKEGKHLFNPDSGAVLRCELDGSKLELIHVGLRNPQKLAFDDHGNLFTYDNNCDSGDKARWVQVVPGGDSGWRCGYQYDTLYGNRGAWNTEKLWHLAHDGQPAYIVPPLAHFGNGPSGITHYPGLGLSDKYKDHFFACDFTSSPGSSVIWSLAVKPKGVSFEVVDCEPFVKNMVPTDCEFGPDGRFYWSDWTGGWDPPNKGRIFAVTDAAAMKNPKVKESQELIAGGMSGKTIPELIALFEHPHQVVRQEAQFELASGRRKSPECIAALSQQLITTRDQRARLHSVWALGQICRRNGEDPVELAKLLKDEDAVIRGHAVLTLAESAGGWGYHHEAMLPMLRDPEPAVRAKAAYALAAIFRRMVIPTQAHPPIMAFADASGSDPYLRQAAIVLLSAYDEGHVDNLLFAPGELTKNQKLVLAVALRRIGGTAAELRLANLLKDADAAVVAEAARGIYDTRMEVGLTHLAKVAGQTQQPDAVMFRALAANFLCGEPEHAKRLAEYAAKAGEPEHLRVVALKLLALWPQPPRRDPITGLTLNLPARDAKVAQVALKPHLAAIFTGREAVRKAAAECTAKLGVREVGPMLAAMVADAKLGANVRVDALYALQTMKAKELGESLTVAQTADPKLKAAARIVRLRADAKVLDEFPAILEDEKTSLVERQMLLAALPDTANANRLLGWWLDRLIAGKAPAELQLEILELAAKRSSLKARVEEFEKGVRKAAGNQVVRRYPEALAGGDAERGREVFLHKLDVACQKCHKLDGTGGEVGPPLNGLGKTKTREYLLESLLAPNAQIAEGYGSVILNLADGKTVSGVLRKKTKESYTIVTPENKTLEIAAADVENEKPDKSAMPEDVKDKLSRRELRDLVEFLAGLKE